MSELADLKVHGETTAGWCAATPPNETTDDQGRPHVPPPGDRNVDPRPPGRRAFDDPEVQALRENLRRTNGMKGLEI